MDTYQRKNYFRDLVCFTGSDSDNYNEMPHFSQSKFLLLLVEILRVQYNFLFLFSSSEKMSDFL